MTTVLLAYDFTRALAPRPARASRGCARCAEPAIGLVATCGTDQAVPVLALCLEHLQALPEIAVQLAEQVAMAAEAASFDDDAHETNAEDHERIVGDHEAGIAWPAEDSALLDAEWRSLERAEEIRREAEARLLAPGENGSWGRSRLLELHALATSETAAAAHYRREWLREYGAEYGRGAVSIAEDQGLPASAGEMAGTWEWQCADCMRANPGLRDAHDDEDAHAIAARAARSVWESH